MIRTIPEFTPALEADTFWGQKAMEEAVENEDYLTGHTFRPWWA